jgi:hypothetical protein
LPEDYCFLGSHDVDITNIMEDTVGCTGAEEKAGLISVP